MESDFGKTRLLVLALVALAALSAVVLAEVLYTVVFAITVAYTLFPFRQAIVDRGYSRRVATSVVTGIAGLALVGAVVPVVYVLYRRRSVLLDIARELPARIPIVVGEFSYTIETTPLIAAAGGALRDAALSVASAATVLSLKAMLLAIVVYGLLARPGSVRSVAVGLAPTDFYDVLERYHERVHATLVGIYVVQAATAAATSVVAYVVFALLGYDAALTLAVVAGVLQFVPVVGPSVVIVALAATDVVAGNGADRGPRRRRVPPRRGGPAAAGCRHRRTPDDAVLRGVRRRRAHDRPAGVRARAAGGRPPRGDGRTALDGAGDRGRTRTRGGGRRGGAVRPRGGNRVAVFPRSALPPTP